MESMGGAMVRALTPHQCGLGSNPGVDAICGLSLLLVLFLAPRGFSPGTPVFPYPQNQQQIQIRSGILRTPRCFVGKQITVTMSCLLLCTF